MSSFHIQTISEEPVDWGESPHWDESRQRLSYVDCFAKRIYQIDPESGKSEKFNVSQQTTSKSMPITTALPALVSGQSDTPFLITLGNTICKYSPSTEEILNLAEIESGSNFNNGKCDPEGRLWVGSYTGMAFL